MFVCIHKKIIVVWKSKLPWDGEGLLSYIEERRAWNNCYGKWAPSSSRCSSFHFVRAVGSQFLDSILPDTSFSTFLPTTTLCFKNNKNSGNRDSQNIYIHTTDQIPCYTTTHSPCSAVCCASFNTDSCFNAFKSRIYQGL